MADTETPKLTCMRCERPVGLIGRCRARAFTFELTEDEKEPKGAGPVCRDRGSCKRASKRPS